MLKAEFASLSDKGKVREKNEDSTLCEEYLFGVADGMGGHSAGEVASFLALLKVKDYVDARHEVEGGVELVGNAISQANRTIHEKAKSNAAFHGMGTTITILYPEKKKAFLGHVGDSRAYLFEEGKLQKLTTDHSLVAKLLEDGEITEEETKSHPRRNIILKALGISPEVEPDVFEVPIRDGDIFLLATDGLTSSLDDEVIEDVLSMGQKPSSLARSLVDLALEAGGSDNISVVVVRFSVCPP